MTNPERIEVPASEESISVQLLHEYGYQCVVYRHELPWLDWYAILNEQGGIHIASKHSDLFESIAEVMLMSKLMGGE